jgi:amidase
VSLGAVVAREDEAAMAAADCVDAASTPGALAGTAVTVKDWIDVAGLPCEGEQTERSGRVPDRDATVVARLRAAGAIVIAKTQPQADHPIHGRCHHPDDPERTPGGSSSGEAALVGAGASLLGLGSDSGGSIRLPAAWCGAAGLKPSHGLVPDTGHAPVVGFRQDGRTVIGPMATNVARLTAVLRVIAGPDGIDGGCAPVPIGEPADVAPGTLRVAVIESDGGWRPQPSTAAALDGAASVVEERGGLISGEAFPVGLDESFDITMRYWRRVALSGAEADQQLRDWDRYVRRVSRAARDVDVILSPVVADVAPVRRDMTGEDYAWTLPWSLSGWPAASVPFGVDGSTGLPLAVQVVATRWHDHVALAVAGWIEEAGGATWS